jgi:hypothetical protein
VNTWLSLALMFAVAGVLALLLAAMLQGRGRTNPDDYGGVVLGFVLLCGCEALAAVLAAIGLIVKLL